MMGEATRTAIVAMMTPVLILGRFAGTMVTHNTDEYKKPTRPNRDHSVLWF